MMNKVANERHIIDIYSDTLIQSYFLGRSRSGDKDLWYHHVEFFLFSLLFLFLFFFCFPKFLLVACKALPTILVILSIAFEALSTASEAFSATSDALSAAS